MHEIVNEAAKLAPELRLAIANLKKDGWKMLGNGTFGAVMEKDGLDWVLKLFRSDDAAYIAFVHLAQAHPNPHFPVFTRNILSRGRLSVVRVEKLAPCKTYHVTKFGHLTGLYMETTDDPPDDVNLQKCRDFVKATPALQQACDLIAGNLLGRFNLDIETENNVMMRGDTFVFSDPVNIALPE